MKHKLSIIVGLSGSGKSAIAESLAAKSLSPLLSVDPIEASFPKAVSQEALKQG